jgi:hypothetical protein
MLCEQTIIIDLSEKEKMKYSLYAIVMYFENESKLSLANVTSSYDQCVEINRQPSVNQSVEKGKTLSYW